MRALVFVPGHAIWAWGFQGGLMAEALKMRGHNVQYLYCDGEYGSTCMAQASKGVPWTSSPEAKAEICRQCKANAGLISNEMNLPSASINSFITLEEREEVKRLVAAAAPETYQEIKLNGIPVGRLAMYEFVIQNMKRSVTFEGTEWNYYCDILANCCKAVYGFSRACETFRPDVCIIEHTAYSYNRACQMVAEAKGISAYYLNESSANVAHSSELLVLAKGDPSIFSQNYMKGWSRSKDIPVSADEARSVTNHFIALIKAKGRAYSTAKRESAQGVRERFGIKPNQKLLLAMTSSYDEMFAGEVVGNFAWTKKSSVFEMQSDWIRALLEFIRNRPELFLLIRIHPREFMAKKSGGRSEHAESLMQELKDLPPNVAVNLPSDGVSIYDLVEETAVGLNAWSTAGSELGFFGLPVVVYCGHLLLYPSSLNYSASNREEYFQFIDQALQEAWSFERVRTFYRFYATHQLRIAANISDSFPFNLLRKRGILERAYFRFRRTFDPLYDFVHLLKRRSPNLAAGEQIERLLLKGGDTFLDLSEDGRGTSGVTNGETAYETNLIRTELRRLYTEMYGGIGGAIRSGTLQSRLRDVIE